MPKPRFCFDTRRNSIRSDPSAFFGPAIEFFRWHQLGQHMARRDAPVADRREQAPLHPSSPTLWSSQSILPLFAQRSHNPIGSDANRLRESRVPRPRCVRAAATLSQLRIFDLARGVLTHLSQSRVGACCGVVIISTVSPLRRIYFSETSWPLTRAPEQWWPTSE